MAGLKEIRTRIASIKTTRQVTSAMKMVSAAKLKKAQDAIVNFRPYAAGLHEVLSQLAGTMDCNVQSPYCIIRPAEKILVVVIASNRGLCGGFNLNTAREAATLIYDKYAPQLEKGNLDILSIGKQGERQLTSAGLRITSRHHDVWSGLNYASVMEIANGLLDDFISLKYDRIDLVYNEFVNAAVQNPVVFDFLPVKVPRKSDYDDGGLVLYEPSKTEIAFDLIPRLLRTEFFRAMLDSHAAEHGARMTAMHLATDNATELIGELTLQYNKARQAAITKEILEITAGAEALRAS